MSKRAIAAVVLPGLILAGIGLSHPVALNADTASWWATMHMILVPIFPLLALAVWVSLRRDSSPLGWAGRVAAVVYTAFYGTLDAVSGIAAGTVVGAIGEVDDGVLALFDAGRTFGRIGALAFFVAVVAVLGSTWRAGVRSPVFWAAAVVLLASSYFFTTSHIYAPLGVAAMVGFSAGLGALEVLRQRSGSLAQTIGSVQKS